MRNILDVITMKVHPGNEIKKNELREASERMGDRKGAHKILVRKSEGKNHLDDLGVDGRFK
jgi:hypothetical protein